MNDPAREYFWGITLDKENPEYTWSFDEEEDDSDYLIHTLFLKQAVLGASAVKDERNLVQVETKNFDQKDIKIPLFSLTLGRNDMAMLDVSFGHEVPVVFKLVEGTGPVCVSAQQLVEYPDDRNASQDESELECTEDELEEEEDDEESPKKPTKKRKAPSQKSAKSKKKGKMEVRRSDTDEEDDDDDMEDDDDDESMDEDDDEDESSPEKSDKKKGKKGGKEKEKPKAKAKAGKASPKKETAKKAKKTGKAK